MSMKSAVLRVVVILGCLTGAAVGTMAQQATAHGTTTVVQMSYYALPGKEQEVLSIRLSACDVLEKHGVTRGRVLTRSDGLRETKHGDNPDVVWEVSFPMRQAWNGTKRLRASTQTSLPRFRRCER